MADMTEPGTDLQAGFNIKLKGRMSSAGQVSVVMRREDAEQE